MDQAIETVSCPGLRLTLKATGEETGGEFTLVEYAALSASPGPPLHIHRGMDETCTVLEGSVLFTLDGQTIEARAGEVIVVPRGTPHTFAVPEAACLLFRFSPAGFVGYSHALTLVTAATGGMPDAAMMRVLGEQYDNIPVE